jgi:hypothetical protein
MTQRNFKLSIVADDDNALSDAIGHVTDRLMGGQIHGDLESESWTATFSLTTTHQGDEELE